MGNSESERIVRTLLTKVIERPSLFITLRITKHCNLNCKSCCTFSPLAEEEFLDVEECKSDLKRLSELTKGEMSRIDVLGGEPLLHPNLFQILQLCRKYFHYGNIRLLTNGILLNKQSGEFWEICKENNIIIYATKYPIKINWEEIENKAKKYEVKFEYEHIVGEVNGWVRYAITEKGNRNELHSFLNCNASNECANLYRGKIYPCSIATDIDKLNKAFNTNFQKSEKDYIDIYSDITLEDILKFLTRPVPCCRYCNTFAIKNTDWGISKKEKNEWIID